ncbi:MAG: cellulase family glycosylhydrolase [Bryobacterales bacterium]|nr:cellulase family glycosylhydrolase [Bryobacterales bacterium]
MKLALLVFSIGLAAQPLALLRENPHYFVFRGKPTVLVTSGEHYGAVLNARFDFKKYLDTLAADGLNHTRIFTGLYREVPGSFNIARNTLAPEAADFVSPFVRDSSGVYDLTTWNAAYFARLKEFMAYAGERGIVVEVCLTTTHYNDTHWKLTPWQNNRNGVGAGLAHTDPWTLKDAKLQGVLDTFVEKMARELAAFDNFYFEICNEPYIGGPTLEWQRHMAAVIRKADGGRHLISQNIANHEQTVTAPDGNVSVFNFHYARPPRAVTQNYTLRRPIGMNETGFDGADDATYRIQAWDFLVAGGALYNNLDYSFTVGHEDGSFGAPATTPGGGSAGLRKQLGFLRRVFAGLDLAVMAPAEGVASQGRCLGASTGTMYLCYAHYGELRNAYRPRYAVETSKKTVAWRMQLPEGRYEAIWWDPKTGKELGRGSWQAGTPLTTPEHSEDIALELRRL